ncbi:uracil phosphoribosyltransferase-domain-containing protein [Aspergillus cavernicola]|uniref:uracil phosphoribosyltransferase n=1 Tax=Aspergillus cavernicola TaxID=176166 RepID=A0ABR4I108_9EURO
MGRERVVILPQGNHLLSLMTILRDSSTDCKKFAETAEKVGDKIISAALDMLPPQPTHVACPTGVTYEGVQESTPVCGVAILRAGASLENALRRGYTGPLSFGKMLIQRDETTCLPTLYYAKFPPQIGSQKVLILEPMLATGGSACAAIDGLKQRGVLEENIIFVNVLASESGVETLLSRFPGISLVTATIDKDLTSNNIISPGLGDFGDRFYGTDG